MLQNDKLTIQSRVIWSKWSVKWSSSFFTANSSFPTPPPPFIHFTYFFHLTRMSKYSVESHSKQENITICFPSIVWCAPDIYTSVRDRSSLSLVSQTLDKMLASRIFHRQEKHPLPPSNRCWCNLKHSARSHVHIYVTITQSWKSMSRKCDFQFHRSHARPCQLEFDCST